MNGYDYEVVNKKIFQIKLNEDWEFVQREIFILSKISRHWKSSSKEQKMLDISILTLVVALTALIVSIYK